MAVIFSSILQHVPSLQLLPLVCPQALTTSYTRSPVFKHLHHYVPSLWSPLVVCPQPDSFMQQCVCVYILHIHTHTHIYTHNTMCCLQKTTPKRAHQPSASSHAPFNNNSIKDVVNLWKKFSKKPPKNLQDKSHISSLWNTYLKTKLLQQSPHTTVTADIFPRASSVFVGSGAVIDDVTPARELPFTAQGSEGMAHVGRSFRAHASVISLAACTRNIS